MKKAWVVLLLLLNGCQIRTLNPHSQVAEDQAMLIYLSFAIMIVVMAVVFILLFRFAWKYKQTAKNKNDVPEEINSNKRLEITWTLFPVLLLAILAVPTILVTYQVSPKSTSEAEGEATDEAAIHIQVTAERFDWTFTYENGRQSDRLVLPVNKQAVLHLQSEDVIHSFWVPELGGKQDVIPGKEILFKVTPEKTGTFLGKCAEFCGVNHSLMRFDTNVLQEQAYRTWLQEE
ncbi:cytochrome c oxidase subunit II [Sediminibacillus dalangtanensis]|uniref:Cytochrome c oxidase subunit 2 n=1 Tax=Sediminibacillus dalangtanensis TaxID=2729421 RepID=A0ABX7VVD9_9BACI|nr:cytochrome c oxidase subunit II [Sediminibacillus dalangtanensis]QTN00923.1 cytochrome c oxidase subunit II [Sediminibacillus dalangtanensis]